MAIIISLDIQSIAIFKRLKTKNLFIEILSNLFISGTNKKNCESWSKIYRVVLEFVEHTQTNSGFYYVYYQASSLLSFPHIYFTYQ